MVMGLSTFSQPTQAPPRGADDQGAAGTHALDRVLDRAGARIAAAIDEDDLLAAGGDRTAIGRLIAGVPVGTTRAVVPAPGLPTLTALARGRVEQQAEVRTGLAFDARGGLGLNLGRRDREACGDGQCGEG